MALELRPNCEFCDVDLPPGSTEARICSYECTFRADCVEHKLHNVCTNCTTSAQTVVEVSRPGRSGLPRSGVRGYQLQSGRHQANAFTCPSMLWRSPSFRTALRAFPLGRAKPLVSLINKASFTSVNFHGIEFA
jgi:hypothetical protein